MNAIRHSSCRSALLGRWQHAPPGFAGGAWVVDASRPCKWCLCFAAPINIMLPHTLPHMLHATSSMLGM